MGFWIFMLIMSLLIPLTMLGFGKLFLKKAPANINYVFGYRTGMSMKNKDTWEFAHKYCGKLWYVSGWIMLFASIIVMFFVIRKDDDIVGTVGAVLCCAQMIPLIGSIIPTEMALHKTFDQNGNRK